MSDELNDSQSKCETPSDEKLDQRLGVVLVVGDAWYEMFGSRHVFSAIRYDQPRMMSTTCPSHLEQFLINERFDNDGIQRIGDFTRFVVMFATNDEVRTIDQLMQKYCGEKLMTVREMIGTILTESHTNTRIYVNGSPGTLVHEASIYRNDDNARATMTATGRLGFRQLGLDEDSSKMMVASIVPNLQIEDLTEVQICHMNDKGFRLNDKEYADSPIVTYDPLLDLYMISADSE